MLQLIEVSKKFGHINALENVCCKVEKGERIVILGPSGCGKTTLLRLIAGFDKPDKGEIKIDGLSVAGNGKFVLPNKRRISMVFQDLALWPHMTVLKHLLYCSDSETRAGEILELVGLKNHGNKYPHQLSGGEKQRLALGRAIISEPEILLFDEPLTSLDPILKEEMLGVILDIQIKLKTTMVYVTHDQREAAFFSDRGAVMRQGRIEQAGKWCDIIKEPSNDFVELFMKGMKSEIQK